MAVRKRTALCILNPEAGIRRFTDRVRESVTKTLGNRYTVCFHETTCSGDARETVCRNVADTDLLVCCGGDGTLNEIVTGLREADATVPICYVPRGTTNDIAKSLRIPKRVKKSVALASSSVPVWQDVGQFNGRQFFTYIAAFGAFTAVSYETPQRLKNRLGYLAYLIGSVKSLGRIKPYRVKAVIDGEQAEGEFIYGSISNSYSIGGAIRLTGRGVRLDDGKFEVMLVRKPKGLAGLLRVVINCILFRQLDERNGVMLKSFSSLEMQFEEEAAWTLDGEFAGKHRAVSVDILPKAVSIFAGGTFNAER